MARMRCVCDTQLRDDDPVNSFRLFSHGDYGAGAASWMVAQHVLSLSTYSPRKRTSSGSPEPTQ